MYAGLDTYRGIAGTNGQLLIVGGAAASLIGIVYRIHPATGLRYLIGGLGFLLTGFSAYLVAQLLSIYKELHAHGIYLPTLGPGVFLSAGGALVVFGTLFVPTDGELRAPRDSEQGHEGLAPVTASLVTLSVAAATVHLTVASGHFAEYVLFGLFFVVVGVAQIVWAALVAIIGPADWLLKVAVGNALVIALWVASRTTGVPLGPNPSVPERVGYADLATTVFEVLLVALSVALLSRSRAAAFERRPALWAIPLLITPTAALAVLSAVGAIGFLPASG